MCTATAPEETSGGVEKAVKRKRHKYFFASVTWTISGGKQTGQRSHNRLHTTERESEREREREREDVVALMLHHPEV